MVDKSAVDQVSNYNTASGGLTTKVVSSAYTTQGEDVIYVDESGSAVTVTLASGDVATDAEIEVYNLTGANTVTVDTEGGEKIGGASSVTIDTAGWSLDFVSDGTDWYTSLDGEFDSLTAAEAEITNETFVRATRGSNSTSTTAGTWMNPFDGESKDVRGEFNSSAQFVPDETGEYEVVFTADVRGNTTKGDAVDAKVQDVDAGTKASVAIRQNTYADSAPSAAFTVNLSAGTTYELQVRNKDSSFVIYTANTRGVIKRSVVA